MAKAKAYDGWEDAGLTFSTEELEAYLPEQWAQGRVAELCVARQIVMRRTELPDISKPLWWKESASLLKERITWYCKAVPLVAVTPEELGDLGLPGRTTKVGKELSQAAVLLEEDKWVGEWGAESEHLMRYVVTIGRRAGVHCKWDSNRQKQSNRLANCVHREILATQILDKKLASYT